MIGLAAGARLGIVWTAMKTPAILFAALAIASAGSLRADDKFGALEERISAIEVQRSFEALDKQYAEAKAAADAVKAETAAEERAEREASYQAWKIRHEQELKTAR